MPNSLFNSLSPYLRQHANNPVDWQSWDSAALEKAQKENKPIFLSIGYSACHWCHVMAHESFEDPETASIMNKHFVNIKVDREERPDLDDIYMAAVVALTGQGGWPMSVFLTPALQPFYGGTYFPPESRYGLPSFKQVLLSLAEKWETEQDDILQAGKNLTIHLKQVSRQSQNNSTITTNTLDTAEEALIKSYDWQSGGWGNAPKFPQPMALEFLLRRHTAGHPGTLEPVIHALRAMSRGGMYDIAGGGFARYSTDRNWLIPHFEKMLYDNAQLTRVYLHAWLITREPALRKVVDETLQFIIREMTDPPGGFYSSLDADSERVEGKFYVWTLEEIRAALGERDELFDTAFGLTQNGNWDGKTILRREMDDQTLAARFNLDESEITVKLRHSLDTLLSKRGERVRPGTDDKVLASWNGLMLAAFAEAARILDNDQYLEVARRNGDFLLGAMLKEDGLRHAWRDGQTGSDSFLEDYSACILGFLELYQADHNTRWYKAADTLTNQMITQFSDEQGGFFDTPAGAEIVLSRPKNLQDNAVPSGNAMAAEALLKMADFSENSQYRTLAENMFRLVGELAVTHPTGFARWLSAADLAGSPRRKQITIVGSPDDPRTRALLKIVNSQYVPDRVLAVSGQSVADGAPPMLTGREMIEGKPTAYVCEQFVCKQPVTSPEDLKKLLQNE